VEVLGGRPFLDSKLLPLLEELKLNLGSGELCRNGIAYPVAKGRQHQSSVPNRLRTPPASPLLREEQLDHFAQSSAVKSSLVRNMRFHIAPI
jgi:hypothetical protein